MLSLGRFVFLFAATLCGLITLVFTIAEIGGHRGSEVVDVLFALGCALSIAGYIWLGRKQQARLYAIREAALREGVLEAGVRAWAPLLLALMLLGLGFAALAAFNKGNMIMAAVFAAGGLFLLVALGEYARRLLRPGPTLRIDTQGIDHAMFDLIHWRDVIGLHLQSITIRSTTQHSLHIGVRNPLRNIARLPLFKRGQRRKWERDNAAYGSVAIPLNALDVDARLIHDTALNLRQRHPAPLLAHWHPQMDAGGIDVLLRQAQTTAEIVRTHQQLQANPQQAAVLQARLDALRASEQSQCPHTDAAIGKSIQQQVQASKRRNRWLIAMGIVLVALRVWAAWLRMHRGH